MLTVSDGLQHLYLYKLNEVGIPIEKGVNTWLAEGSEYLTINDNPEKEFTINTYDHALFLKPYAFDINRLACASLESLRDIQKNDWQPKFLGWNMTKFYYSAFFSAHCILRITGNAILNIEKNAIDKVKKITKEYGHAIEKVQPGYHCLDIDHTRNSYRFYKDSSLDESHKGLWKRFKTFLEANKVTIFTQLPQAEALKVADKIKELEDAISNWNSNGAWLSRVRNDVNYSQSYGIWFPYKDFIPDYHKIYDYLDLNVQNPMSIDLASFRGKDLLYFVRTCQLINAICFDMLKDLKSRHPSNRSFINSGFLKFYNLYLKN